MSGRWAAKHAGRIAAVAAGVLLALAPGASARDGEEPHITTLPAITGTPAVGERLDATAAWTPAAATARWTWMRCQVAQPKCRNIAGATAASYTPIADDVGSRLAVLVTVRSSGETESAVSPPTGVVAAAPPAPAPPPGTDPAPGPDPSPGSDPAGDPGAGGDGAGDLAPATSGATPITLASVDDVVPFSTAGPAVQRQAAPAALRPFPRVRIRGTLIPGGALVSMLSVRAPVGVRIKVTCSGLRCPVARRVYRARTSLTRLRRFETFLPSGVGLVVDVTRRGAIGKRTYLRIRDGRAPSRRDRCIVPGNARAVTCAP